NSASQRCSCVFVAGSGEPRGSGTKSNQFRRPHRPQSPLLTEMQSRYRRIVKAQAMVTTKATRGAMSRFNPAWVHGFTRIFLSTGHMKKPDPLCARLVEHSDRLGCRPQQDLAALSFQIGFSFPR